MGDGLESSCVGRVSGVDGAVRLIYFTRKMHGQTTLKVFSPQSKGFVCGSDCIKFIFHHRIGIECFKSRGKK